MLKKKEEKQQMQQDKNFVLIVKYECGESGFLTNQADLPLALQEYNEIRLKQLEENIFRFLLLRKLSYIGYSSHDNNTRK